MSENDIKKELLISYRLEKARDTLQDAHLLMDQGGSPASIINRAYYAMFYAVSAILTTLGMEPSKHSGVIALFDQYFVKSGEFPIAMSKALHKAFDLRQIGDYREFIEFDEEQAQEIIDLTDQFVEKVEEYFAR